MRELNLKYINSFPKLLGYRAKAHPDRQALTFLRFGSAEDDSLTYGELGAEVGRLAAGLAERFEPGERALLLFAQGLEFPVAFFGCLAAGIVPAPLYPPQRNQNLGRLEAVLSDARASFALTDPGTLADLERRRGESGEHLPVPVFGVDAFEGGDGRQLPEWSRDDLAFLQYTSGSTGRPKGVMVSHGNLLANSEDLDRGWNHSPDSVMVSWLPLFHDMGLIYGLLQPIYKGFPAVLMAPFSFLRDPLRWLHAITRFRGTHSAAPNFAFEMCVERATPERCRGLDLSSWRMSMNGAEPIHAETLRRFTETFRPYGYNATAMSPGYGLAEVTLKVASQRWAEPPTITAFDAEALEGHRVRAVAADEPPEVARRTLVGCGRSEVDTVVAIVDPETGERRRVDEAGEIWVAGESVTQGYWNRPEQTEETFGATIPGEGEQRYLRTGDLGFVHDGELYIAGRLKDLVIVRGRNFYPQDIERTVGECHPALRAGNGVAFSLEVERGEELVLVQEVLRSAGKDLDEVEVFAEIRRAVAEEFDLQVFEIVLVRQGSVGKTSSGKLQRAGTKQEYLEERLEEVTRWRRPQAAARPAPEVPAVEDRGALEASMARLQPIFEAALGLVPGEMRPDEPIARYGLSSRVAVELAATLEETFRRPTPATLLYDYPTLTAVARFLTAGEAAGRQPAAGSAPGSGAVVVVGLGCRFPGAANPTAFWELLRDGVDAIRPLPPERAALLPERGDAPPGGYLDGVELFDADYFGISPREVERMDPQQRLLLEVAVEALEDAALGPERLAGLATGVFVGLSTHDYERLQVEADGGATAYTGTGNAASIAANRLSYALDLRGPSMAVDTACSSSLVALHLARRALRTGECDAALAGGVNLLLDTQITGGFREAQMMAADGRCKTFDAAADGYVRSEGCGLLVLRRLEDARRDGDPILGVIHGSALNQDGRSNGLTAPNSLAQEEVQRRALADAGVTARRVGYVEAHGTGTPLGDPIEISALRRVYGEDRVGPCAVGSVKTNIGHLEAAAGVAGVIKVLLALRQGQIPPHLHLQELNPEIELGDGLRIPTALTPWPTLSELSQGGAEGAAWAAVSSFGFGGTNAHLLLGPPPAAVAIETQEEHPALLPLSARRDEALAELAARFAAHPLTPWPTVAAGVAGGRRHHDRRLAVVAADAEEARAALEAFTVGRTHPALVTQGEAARWKARPRLGFLFTGQGSQAPGMGRGLYDTEPVFRAALERCEEVLDPSLETPLLEVLFPPEDAEDKANRERIHQTAYTQVTLFALEYALAELLASWGIVPDAVLGHSIGEYVAACRAGVMELEEALPLVATRGRVMQALPAGGAMLTLFTTEEEVLALIDAGEDELSIAAVNAPRKVVASGPEAAIEALAARADEAGVEHRRLKVSHAFHSALMDPAVEEFEAAARPVSFREPRIPLYSNRTGRPLEGAPDAAYWRDHLRHTVRFADGAAAMMEDCDLLLEVGPRPVLWSLTREIARETVREDARESDADIDIVPTLKAGQDDRRRLLAAVGRLYCAGVELSGPALGAALEAGPRIAGLPTYPFQRSRHWFEPIARKAAARPRLVPYAALAEDPGLEKQLRVLAARHGVGAGSVSQVTGKSLLFVDSRGDAFCFLGQRGRSVFALDYTGPEAAWPAFLEELEEVCRGAGLELNLLEETDRRLPELRQRGFACTTIGTWQDLDELPDFTLAGGKMRRLRYLVNRYQSDGEAEVLEITEETPAEGLRRELREILHAWAEAKGMGRRFADHIEEAVIHGLPLARHRVFVVRRDGRVDGVVLILPAPALNGYLMDMEFYREDANLGWVEFGIARILEGLIEEGAQRFSLGLTLGTRIEAQAGDDAAVRELFETLHDEGILNGDANFQFKSKFRPTTHSAYLCRAPGADPQRAMDFVAALNEPFAPVEELKAALEAAVARRAAAREGAAAATEPTTPAVPGLVQRQLDLAEGGPVFESLYSTAHLPFLEDHRVGGLVVMPATGYAEVAWAVAERLGAAPTPSGIESLSLSEVLPVPDGGGRKFQIAVHEDGGRFHLRFASREAGGPPSGSPWTRHGEAVLATAEDGVPAAVDLAALRERLGEETGTDDVYRRLAALGLEYGPTFRALQGLRVAEGEALGRVSPPPGLDLAGYHVHPALLDACLHAFFPLAGLEGDSEGGDRGEVLLPVRLEGLYRHGDGPGRDEEIFAHLESLESPAEEPAFRLRLLRGDGGVWVDCAAFRLRRLTLASFREAQQRRLKECLFVPTWKPVPAPVPKPVSPEAKPVPKDCRWLLLTDDATTAKFLTEALEARGGRALTAPVAEAARAIASAREGAPGEVRIVLHAPDRLPTDQQDDAEEEATSWTEALLDGPLGGVLAAVRALAAEADGRPSPRLWFLTEGRGGALGGLLRVVEREHPDLWGGWVDGGEAAVLVSDQGALEGWIRAADALCAVAGGPPLHWDGEGFREEVLIPWAGREFQRPDLDPEGLYLVTGGLGGLGLAVAGRLVDLGARRLALLGRSQPDAAQEEALEALRRRGQQSVEIEVLRADVADAAALASVLEPRLGELRGLVHAAGTLDDRLLVHQDRESFRRVLAPKVDGAWNLHRLTQHGGKLDFFVLFSSISSLLGTPGQGNYAAGNAFLDALAEERRGRGLPGTSIHWGPWATVGMAARDGEQGARRGAQGVRALEVPLALSALEAALEATLRGEESRWAVLDLEPGPFLAGPLAALPVLAEVTAAARRRGGGAAPVDAGRPSLDRENLPARSPEEQQAALQTFLAAEIGRAVGVDPASLDPDRSTDQLGIDSLVVMELRNRIKAEVGVEIPASFFFEFPAIAAIAERLRQGLAGPAEAGRAQEPEAGQPAVTASEVDEMSGDDVDALLSQLLSEES